jgi:hypothetical protein
LYAGAVIDTLRRERDLARVAHEHTRQIFQDRIDNLEAQLARRDAELEACGGDVEPPMLEASSVLKKEDQKGKKFRKEQVLIPQEEVLTLQQQSTTRNKTLEEEIRGLFKRVRIFQVCFSASLHVVFSSNKPASHTRHQNRYHHCPLSQSPFLPNSNATQTLFRLPTFNLTYLSHVLGN